MATLYKKRGKWYIEYILGGIRKIKNTKLEATEDNFPKAEKLKNGIEELINSQKDNIESFVKENITLNNAIKEFKKIYINGRSESHRENFEYVMKRFNSVVSGNRNVKSIKVENVTEFVVQMKKELAQATQVTYFQYLSSFLTYLKERGYIDQIPIGKGIRPKKAVKNIICFDPIDLDNILDAAKKRNIKYYNAYKMFLLTGQRPGDVLKLQIRDIDFHHKILYFRINKTSSEFKFPIYSKLERFLREEMKLSEDNDRDAYLFPDLTVLGAGEAFRKIKRSLGLTRNQYYTLKTFRKSFATDISKRGMTIQEVQALLDHKSTSTTLRYYANVKADELKNKIDKLMI